MDLKYSRPITFKTETKTLAPKTLAPKTETISLRDQDKSWDLTSVTSLQLYAMANQWKDNLVNCEAAIT